MFVLFEVSSYSSPSLNEGPMWMALFDEKLYAKPVNVISEELPSERLNPNEGSMLNSSS